MYCTLVPILVTAAKVEAVLRVYCGVRKVPSKVKEVKEVAMVKEEVSEDEGEVISSSEDEEDKKDRTVMAAQSTDMGVGSSKVEDTTDKIR